MFEQPLPEHAWLNQLVGEWRFESECQVAPDQPPMQSVGKVSARSLGGMWLVAEGEMPNPAGGAWTTIITLGYSTKSQQYVGTFLGSMGSYLWNYVGSLDAAKRVLTLDTEGPKFDQTGLTRYQDIVEVVDADHWILRSQIWHDDGTWKPFMTGHHYRAK